MKFKCIVEYEYPIEHKPPVKAEIILHGDRVITDKIIQLPQKHGDLIDRKALINNGIQKGFCDWYDEIKYAPIIIEADKGE